MEATIIKLEPTEGSSNVTVRMASFEEAFGDYSEARGKGRARRKARKMDRIANKRAVRTERRKLKSDRQEERLERRSTRKQTRQEMRNQQQEARQNRRANVRDERQANREARNLRKMTTEEGDQERENYGQEQENYRESIAPQDSEQDTQGGGGYADEQGGGYADEQGGGYSDDQNGEASRDWGSAPETYDDQNSGDGGYGDDNSQETPYNQEESEFQDDSYFNVEGMEGKVVVSPMVKDTVSKIRNNQSAFQNLKDRRNLMARNSDNTTGVSTQMKKCYGRICELKSQLEKYCTESSNPQVCESRRRQVKMALKRGSKPREINQYGGSEVPVSSDLNPKFEPNRITVPATSNFDAYSDLGRPIIVNGVAQNDSDYSSDDLLTDSDEPTTIELFSNADGTNPNKKAFMSIAIGIGVGALAIYLAKKKGWI